MNHSKDKKEIVKTGEKKTVTFPPTPFLKERGADSNL